MNKFYLINHADYVNIKKKEGGRCYGVGFTCEKVESGPSAKIEVFSAVYLENSLSEAQEITADTFHKEKAEMLKSMKKLLK